MRLGEALGFPPERIHILRLAAVAHDVGKIGVRDDVLFKPGDLTSEERGRVELGARGGTHRATGRCDHCNPGLALGGVPAASRRASRPVRRWKPGRGTHPGPHDAAARCDGVGAVPALREALCLLVEAGARLGLILWPAALFIAFLDVLGFALNGTAIRAHQLVLFVHGKPHGDGRFKCARQGACHHAIKWSQVLPHQTRKSHTLLRKMVTRFHADGMSSDLDRFHNQSLCRCEER